MSKVAMKQKRLFSHADVGGICARTMQAYTGENKTDNVIWPSVTTGISEARHCIMMQKSGREKTKRWLVNITPIGITHSKPRSKSQKLTIYTVPEDLPLAGSRWRPWMLFRAPGERCIPSVRPHPGII